MTAPGANIEAIYPLTPVQEGILFHTLYAPGSPLYFQQYSVLLEGTLDEGRYREAWQLVIDRHETLRSLLTWEGRERPLQIVRNHVEPQWRIEDWREEPVERHAERLAAFLTADRKQGFALDVAPLMRFALMRIGDDAHRFVWSHHHVVVDGWSMGIILDEVFYCYEALMAGAAPDLAPPAPYRDYVRWLHEHDPAIGEDHWRRLLAGFTTATRLRVETPGVASPWAERHDEEIVRLSASATRRLTSFGRTNGLTLNTIFRGAWALVLNRYSGEDDVVFGATVSGRPPELDGAMDMVGLFINTLPVRAHIEPAVPIVDWLRRLQLEQIDAAAFESTPLVDVQRWSDVPKGEPIFQTLLVFENVPHPSSQAGVLASSDIRYLQRSNYPLAVLVMPGDELEMILLYDADRYQAGVIRRMARQLVRTLEAISEDPIRPTGEVPFFPPDELAQIVLDWNRTEADYPASETVHSLVLSAAERSPDRPAVIGEGATLTYADLVARARVLAGRLRRLGVGPDARVGVAGERSAGTVVAILGVLLAGGAYVPLDPRQPPVRSQYLVSDTSAVAVVVGRDVDLGDVAAAVVTVDVGGGLIDASPDDERVIASGSGPDDLAYVLFTSGSTGRPKGVAVTHRNLVNSTHARLHAYGGPVTSFLLLSPFHFDSSVAGLFSSLTAGGTLVLPGPDMEKDVRHLADLIAAHQITHTLALPSLYGLLLDHADPGDLRSLELVMVAGEACPPELVERHSALLPLAHLVNEYGPTEATVWCTVHHAAEPARGPSPGELGVRVPIGKPIANTQAYILDSLLRPVPIGVPGELHIAGLGLARGYLDHPELTAERFVYHDVAGQGSVRLYRTGDIARFLPDGSIDLLGRIDHQVKIRGQRIELSEIEMVLREHPEVGDAVAVALPRAGNEGGSTSASTVLVAYVESAADGALLRQFLAERVPDVMVPRVVVALEVLPRGSTGKVDRAALPDPGHIELEGDGESVAPTSDVERRLAEIWAAVLGLESVGATDNFFDLGGDSILSIRIIARAHEAGLAITPRQFFEFPTIAELASKIESNATGG